MQRRRVEHLKLTHSLDPISKATVQKSYCEIRWISLPLPTVLRALKKKKKKVSSFLLWIYLQHKNLDFNPGPCHLQEMQIHGEIQPSRIFHVGPPEVITCLDPSMYHDSSNHSL